MADPDSKISTEEASTPPDDEAAHDGEKEESFLEGVEEGAREQLGMRKWDRPAVLKEAATKATEADAPYWTILIISGAIATLGVTLDNSAVVIGAMLIAPVLAPIVGLGLGVAAGDARLTVQTAAVVLGSVLAVIAVAAVLTYLLPFRSITTEIAARTRPTTLDLAIAIFSGLAAAVVTVARRSGLAAALPGVAISVALIPPLAVVGFGIGAGWRWPLIKGSLLLIGANLAGIVLSAVVVFFLVGMYRRDVRRAAHRWHEEGHPTGLAAWVDSFSWVRRLGGIESPYLRLGLVLAFVAAVAVPLSGAFQQLTRETRVQRAVNQAAQQFEEPGRSSVLQRQVVQEEDQSRVFLRVATSEWYGEEEQSRFEEEATDEAGEPVELVLEQILASAGALEEVAAMLPSAEPSERQVLDQASTPLPALANPARRRLHEAVASLDLPPGARVLATALSLTPQGDSVRVHYTASRALPEEARQMLRRQLARSLNAPDLAVHLHYVPAGAVPLSGGRVDTSAVRNLVETAARYDSLRLVLVAGATADSVNVASARSLLRTLGVTTINVEQTTGGDTLLARLQTP